MGGAAWRRRQRRLRSWWRHEQQSVAAALATFSHQSAQRSTTARARGGARDEVHGDAPDEAPPPPPGPQFFILDDESVPELSGLRPAALVEPRPQEGIRRHTGEAHELVLDPVVPQLGRDLAVLPDPVVRQFFEALEVVGGVYGPDVVRGFQDVLAQAAVKHQEEQREQEDGGARSSNKMGKKGKKRKRRKKKLPKGPCSSPRHGVGDQDTMFEFAEDENEEVKRYSGQGGTALCTEEMGIEEKVIRGREFIHQPGQLELTMYSDRLHLYSQSSGRCRLWTKIRRRYVRRVGYAPEWTDLLLTPADSQVCCEEWAEQNRLRYVRRVGYAPEWTDLLFTSADSQVCCEEWAEQTLSAKTVKNLICLLPYVLPDFEFQLGRTNAVPGRIHRMLKFGHLNIHDNDEGLGDDDGGNSKAKVQDGGDEFAAARQIP